MDADQWRNGPGRLLREARGRSSKRSVAKRAGIDEALWRQLEEGYRTVRGIRIEANPRDETLEAAAWAVGLDPAEVFAAAGRAYTPDPSAASQPDDHRVSELERQMADAVARIAALERLTTGAMTPEQQARYNGLVEEGRRLMEEHERGLNGG